MRKKRSVIIAASVLALALIAASLGSAQEDLNGSGWWSSANVQRIGNQPGSAEVIMTAYAKQGDAGGPWDCGSRTLAAFGDGATFYPWATAAKDPAGLPNCADTTGFPSSFEGAAILSASDEIAAIVQTLNISYNWAPGDTGGGRALAAYAGVSAPATTVRFPLYKNNHYNEMTTFYIQNAGSAPTSLTATFTPCADQGTTGNPPCLGRANGPYTWNLASLDPGKMVVLDATLASNGANTIPAGDGSYGSLVVTSGGENIAGAVMEHHRDASPANFLKAVAGFAPAQYDSTYYVPQVKNQYPYAASTAGRQCQSKWTSVMVQNAESSAPVNVTVNYTVNENPLDGTRVGTTFADSVTGLAAGETAFFMSFQQEAAGLFKPGDLASATVTATGGDVVVMVNEEARWECTDVNLKDLGAWPGIPASAAKTKLSVPFYKQNWYNKFQGLVVQNVGGSAATFNLKMSVIGSTVSGVSAGTVVEFTHTDSVPSGRAKTFVMPCDGITANLSPVSGDYTSLCDMTAKQGTNVAVVVTSSSGNIVGVITEEKGWWISASAVGDGRSEDAGMYVGIPLD